MHNLVFKVIRILSINHFVAQRRKSKSFIFLGLTLCFVYIITSCNAQSSTNTAAFTTACDAFMTNTSTRCEGNILYVESDGLPTTHNMMVGIVSWQQQVALPQPYIGSNAWQIPLTPTLSDTPISGASDLFRGAVALAVNGVPIFNALNNRGVDAYLAGELDQWGGHSGRGDDYHYHTAPTHLQSHVGIEQPIAYALDGFPLYGLTEPDGTAVVGLDAYNGHFDSEGNYHYHATETYPYINGGMRGVVTYQNGQVEPQPAAQAVRPAGEPLQGAVITAFSQTGSNAYSLQYTYNNGSYTVNYSIQDNIYTFEFIDPLGNSTIETYQASIANNPQPQNDNGPLRAQVNNASNNPPPPPPPPGGVNPPPPSGGTNPPPPPPPPPGGQGRGPDFAGAAAQLGITEQTLIEALGPRPHNFETTAATFGVSVERLISLLGIPTPPPPPPSGQGGANNAPTNGTEVSNQLGPIAPASIMDNSVHSSGFQLTSSVMQNAGMLPVNFTCDGNSITPPLNWINAPSGTTNYAVLMDHQPGPTTPDGSGDYHWYWIAYNIPANVNSLDAGVNIANIGGTLGSNSVNNRQEYAPPCSRGAGEKLYTFHVYALSAAPNIANPATANRETLLAALEGITLAEVSLNVIFDRENPVSTN